MVSPPDKNDGDVGAGGFVGQYFASPDGNGLAYNALGGFGNAGSNGITGAYAATRGEESWSSTSLLLPMAPAARLASTSAIAVSDDLSRALTQTNLDPLTGEVASGFGSFTFLLDVATRDVELFTIADPSGNKTYTLNNGRLAGNADFSRIVYTASVNLLNDGLGSGNRVYLYSNGSRSLVSVLPDGSPALGQLAESHRRPVSTDATVAYFLGQNPQGLYRRDIAAGQTSLVNADENSTEDPSPASATFAGASANGNVAYFISNQRLVDGDTDTTNDLYRYDHSKPAGSRLTLISVDNEPGDGQATVRAAHGVSADGETVLFTADNQLIPGEPTGAGSKLYAYTDGELRYVAPSTLTSASSADRNSKLAEDGEAFAWLSNASGITPEDNGGLAQVYVYDVTADEVHCASCRPGGPNQREAMLMRPVNVGNLVTSSAPRRVVSDEGHVFFQTADDLLPQDTNGKTDVYVWQDGELDLISSGRSGDDSWFLDASVDGSTVFFSTREQLSNWDWDNKIDAYAARTGDALPEPPEPVAPCTGDDCQGPPPLPKPFEAPSSKVEGPGNPDAGPVNCGPLQSKANRLGRKAERLARKAARLADDARRASGERARRLRQRTRKTERQAAQARRRARNARTQLALCREEAQL